MPFKIQRVPRGLQNLLTTSGGETPRELADQIRGSLDLLQFYGTTQLQTVTNNAAAAVEGSAAASVTLSSSSWVTLFAVWGAIVKTATVTALRASVELNRVTLHSVLVSSHELGPFGATETGNVVFGGILPYPLLCPPGSFVQVRPNIIGTDANANVTVFAEFGLLG